MILVSLIFLVRTFLLKLVGSCEGWWTFAPGQGCSRVQRFANWRSSSPGAALVATIEVQRSYVFSPCVCTCILLIGTKVFAWLLTSLAAKFSIIYLLSFSFVHIHLSTVCSSVFPHHVEGIAFPPKNLVAGDVLNPETRFYASQKSRFELERSGSSFQRWWLIRRPLVQMFLTDVNMDDRHEWHSFVMTLLQDWLQLQGLSW